MALSTARKINRLRSRFENYPRFRKERYEQPHPALGVPQPGWWGQIGARKRSFLCIPKQRGAHSQEGESLLRRGELDCALSYSALSAWIGSTFVARRAGTTLAPSPTRIRIVAVEAIANG